MRDSFPRLVDPSQECCFEWSMYMSKISNDNCVNSEDYCPSADNAGEDNEVEFGYDFEPITDEYEYYFNLFVDMADLKYKKKNLEILHAQSPSEFMCKKSGLAVLDGEIEVIQQKIDSPYITNKTETTDTDVNTRRITPMSGNLSPSLSIYEIQRGRKANKNMQSDTKKRADFRVGFKPIARFFVPLMVAVSFQ